MSYPVSLDEYSEAELRAEIRRRLRMRATGRCDYCERHVSTGACRFPGRHKIMRGLHSRWEVRRGNVFADKEVNAASDEGPTGDGDEQGRNALDVGAEENCT